MQQDNIGDVTGPTRRSPANLTQSVRLANGTIVTLRPIRPDDAAAESEFLDRLSPRSRYLRALGAINGVSPDWLARLTRIDLDREMALVAVAKMSSGDTLIGVARYVINPGARSCEFAIVVDDQWQGTGLARVLMDRLIDAARHYHGLHAMQAETLAENDRMLGLARALGFDVRRHPADSKLVVLRRTL